MAGPLGTLRYLYTGTSDFARDLAYYRDVLGAPVLWNLEGFGAHVAAFRIAEGGPLLLLADHRPAPSTIHIFAVPDLDGAVRELAARGWKPGERLEIPNGPCVRFDDPSGNLYALFEDLRPNPFGGEGAPKVP